MVSRIIAGVLVSDIFKKFSQKSKGLLKPDRNVFIYSAHDLTLISAMRALNISDQTSRKPDYAATLAFELHQGLTENNPDEFSVKVHLMLSMLDVDFPYIFIYSFYIADILL